MNEELEEISEIINGMNSRTAAGWLIENYPVDSPTHGIAIMAATSRSWLREDATSLAKYYLSSIPFSDPWRYKALLSISGIHDFIKSITEHLPPVRHRPGLLYYNLAPILREGVTSEEEIGEVEAFLEKLKSIDV